MVEYLISMPHTLSYILTVNKKVFFLSQLLMIHPLTIISSVDKPQSSGRAIPYLPQEEGVAEVCGTSRDPHKT